MSHITPQSFDTFRAIAQDTGVKMDDRLLHRAMAKWLSSRKTAKIKTTVARRRLEQLGQYDPAVLRAGTEVYVEQAKSSKGAYWLGIVREEDRRKKGRPPAEVNLPHDAPKGCLIAAAHIPKVRDALAEMYRRAKPEVIPHIVTAGRGVKELMAEADHPDFDPTQIHERATAIQRELVKHVMVTFWISPYEIAKGDWHE